MHARLQNCNNFTLLRCSVSNIVLLALVTHTIDFEKVRIG